MKPGERACHWAHEFDWEGIDRLLTGAQPDARGNLYGIDVMIRRVDPLPPIRASTYDTIDELRRLVLREGDSVTSLHAVVSGHALDDDTRPVYTVFDVDFRGQAVKSAGGRPPLALFQQCEHIQRPGATKDEQLSVCPNCWRIARAAALILRIVLCDGMGLAEPMYVFTGGNGVHIWFQLPLGSPLRLRNVQELLFERFLTRDYILRSPQIAVELRRLGLSDAIPNEFDAPVTLAAPRNRLSNVKCGAGHPVKLPGSLHDRTGEPALVLLADVDGLPLFPGRDAARRTQSRAMLRRFLDTPPPPSPMKTAAPEAAPKK